jgi:hypothetical protein
MGQKHENNKSHKRNEYTISTGVPFFKFLTSPHITDSKYNPIYYTSHVNSDHAVQVLGVKLIPARLTLDPMRLASPLMIRLLVSSYVCANTLHSDGLKWGSNISISLCNSSHRDFLASFINLPHCTYIQCNAIRKRYSTE